MKYYYLDANNKPTGPKTLDELSELSKGGLINEKTKVIIEGGSEWVDLRTIIVTTPNPAVAKEITDQFNAKYPFSLGAFCQGALHVFRNYFTMPTQLLGSSALKLSEWGITRRLPSSDSEQPVLTYFCIVLKPLFHWFVQLAFLLAGFFVFIGRLESKKGNPFESLFVMIIIWILGFLIQPFVSILFELSGLFVSMANNLKKSADRK